MRAHLTEAQLAAADAEVARVIREAAAGKPVAIGTHRTFLPTTRGPVDVVICGRSCSIPRARALKITAAQVRAIREGRTP